MRAIPPDAADHPFPAPTLPELDRECGKCQGNGIEDERGCEMPCPKCQGSGQELTDAGRDLLRFLQRHPPALTRTT